MGLLGLLQHTQTAIFINAANSLYTYVYMIINCQTETQVPLFSAPDSGMRTIVEAICPSPSEVKAETSNR